MNMEPRAITQLQLLALRTLFAEHFKARAWGLTHEVNGSAYYFPNSDSCACFVRLTDLVTVQVENVFRFSRVGVHQPAAKAATDFIRAKGYRKGVLTCFEPVAKAWERQGWWEAGRVPFDPALAPKAWVEGLYGRPDVLTMRIAL